METQETEIQETSTSTPRKSALPYIVGAGVVILLAAAAFMSVRYFNQPKSGMDSGFGDKNVVTMGGPNGEGRTFELNVKPAAELPVTEPEEMGLFVERKDNSIFIGTGMVTVAVKANDQGDDPQVDTDFSGPKVEIVVSADTVIYRETTQLDEDDPGAEVQQTVELSTIDEITGQSSITVWGRKAGDRIIADVILFSTPFMMKAPGAGKP
jgi:hypothetical protein